ncbi:unnamed protein product, partial [Clonostachys rosea]
MNRERLPAHILFEPYCILCRNTVPGTGKEERDIEPWEEEVLCFTHIPSSDDPSRHRGLMYLIRVPLASQPHFSAPDNIQHELDKVERKLCPGAKHGCCSQQLIANLVHLPCLKLMNRVFHHSWLGRIQLIFLFLVEHHFRVHQVRLQGFKILSLAFENPTPTPKTQNLLWGPQTPISPGSKWSLIDMSISGYSALPIRGNPNSRYIQYLPFDFDDGNRHSLTVYSTSSSTTCIQVDGDPQKRLGRPSTDSCPITFELEPYETIRSIHLTTGYISTCDLEKTHYVSGVFSDAMKSDSGILQALGMMWQPIPVDSLGDAPVPAIPALKRLEPRKFLLGRYPRDPYLTKVSFHGANTLHIQNFGCRCVGILAEMPDSSRIILGQWDSSRKESISALYEKRHGPLDIITFVFSGGDDEHRYVENITLQDSEEAKPQLTWSNLRA